VALPRRNAIGAARADHVESRRDGKLDASIRGEPSKGLSIEGSIGHMAEVGKEFFPEVKNCAGGKVQLIRKRYIAYIISGAPYI
jgi:hypothetical protein